MSPESRPRARFPLARHRLARADFARVYERGRRAQGEHFLVVVLPNERDVTRLGLSVSKKHARRAVDRNRSRRILREAFRLSLAELPPGVDVVIVASRSGRVPSLAEARAALVALVQRAFARAKRRADPPPEAPAP